MVQNTNPWWWNSANYRDGKPISGPRGPSMDGASQMRPVLSPPVAADAVQAKRNARMLNRGKFDDRTLTLIRDYVGGEDQASPHTDGQILKYLLSNDVYSVDLRGVALARKRLGILD